SFFQSFVVMLHLLVDSASLNFSLNYLLFSNLFLNLCIAGVIPADIEKTFSRAIGLLYSLIRVVISPLLVYALNQGIV
ncbi:MAG: hypothetical protein NC548_42045, partial [Lachnospiraceae bacterium]|nr:hypothetical protein [Lachnospiraceae bacterium]